jgi:hypothetical protein
MNYRASRIGHHFLVAWDGTPEVPDVEALAVDIKAAHAGAGEKLEYWLLIIGDTVRMPAPDARAAMQAGMPDALVAIQRFDVVLRGDGVKASLLRSGLRAMAVVTRIIDRVTMHDGVERAIRKRGAPPHVAEALRALTR